MTGDNGDPSWPLCWFAPWLLGWLAGWRLAAGHRHRRSLVEGIRLGGGGGGGGGKVN